MIEFEWDEAKAADSFRKHGTQAPRPLGLGAHGEKA
jgi:hypothetical protein